MHMGEAVSPLDAIKTEIATYEAHKRDLLRKARGKFVLIKGTRIVGIYKTERAALDAGYRRFGSPPFLVEEIRRTPRRWFV